jgi:hypothetical protein
LATYVLKQGEWNNDDEFVYNVIATVEAECDLEAEFEFMALGHHHGIYECGGQKRHMHAALIQANGGRPVSFNYDTPTGYPVIRLRRSQPKK